MLGIEGNMILNGGFVFVCLYVMGNVRGRFDESGDDILELIIWRWIFEIC